MIYNCLKYVMITLGLILFGNCKAPSPREQDLKKVLNERLIIDMFDSVLYRGSQLSFSEFRADYDFLSVVYLQNDCEPCYENFLEWSVMMKTFSHGDKHTLLFVIQSLDINSFFHQVKDLPFNEDGFFIAHDSIMSFRNSNNGNIPSWIMDASVLIDSENRIKMVGAPWLNEEMTELFNSIVYEGK